MFLSKLYKSFFSEQLQMGKQAEEQQKYGERVRHACFSVFNFS